MKTWSQRYFAAIDSETQTRRTKSELAVCLAGEDIRRLQITNAQARVVASMDRPGTGVKAIDVRMGDMVDKPR